MPSTHLSIVFNHRFDANLARLDAIYAGRFADVRYLMPFYDGDRPDVVPVYEASSQFQGYFAQAYRDLATIDANFYAFAGDDLLLHPRLNSGNLATELGLRADGLPDAGYTKSVTPLAEQGTPWPHTLPALEATLPDPLVNAAAELPDPAEARRRIERHGLTLPRLKRRRAALMALRAQRNVTLPKHLAFVWSGLERREPYALLAGYSDFVVVPRAALKSFCRWCGVLAAKRMWVEVAIPTALAWACDRMVVEEQTAWRGTEYWGQAAVEAGVFGRLPAGSTDVDALLSRFGDHELYIHPVKLSKFAKPAARPEGTVA